MLIFFYLKKYKNNKLLLIIKILIRNYFINKKWLMKNNKIKNLSKIKKINNYYIKLMKDQDV